MKRYKQNHKKFIIVILFVLCIVLSMPSKAISMHAASCDLVVLVVFLFDPGGGVLSLANSLMLIILFIKVVKMCLTFK